MKNYFSALILVVFAINAATSSKEDVCDIRVRFHENLSKTLVDPTGIRFLENLLNELGSICVDKTAHNGAVIVMDVLTDLMTNPEVLHKVSILLSLIEEPKIHTLWLNIAEGLNSIFDKADIANKTMDTTYRNLTSLLKDENFDVAFEPVAKKLASIVKSSISTISKTVTSVSKMYSSATKLGKKNQPPVENIKTLSRQSSGTK